MVTNCPWLEKEKRWDLTVLARQLIDIARRYRQGGESLIVAVEDCRRIFDEKVEEKAEEVKKVSR